MSRLDEYIQYHLDSEAIGDIDPQVECLKYVASRFELNEEQRYWLAFLFGCCYSAPTVFYIYNEFPDFESVDVGRLSRWWRSNKHRLIFQTDRLRIKTGDKFVETFESYRRLMRGRGQEEVFRAHLEVPGSLAYTAAWRLTTQIRNFGRFSLFIYLELIHELTQYKMTPDRLDVKNAKSSREGLMFAYGLSTSAWYPLYTERANSLEGLFLATLKTLHNEGSKATVWSAETSLCAFRKHCLGKRWVGYYLDRQFKEIKKIEKLVPAGVDWSVLWDYRRETYQPDNLVENQCVPFSSLESPRRAKRN